MWIVDSHDYFYNRKSLRCSLRIFQKVICGATVTCNSTEPAHILPPPLTVQGRHYEPTVARLPIDFECPSESFSVACSRQLLPIRTGTWKDSSLPAFGSSVSRQPQQSCRIWFFWMEGGERGFPRLEGTSEILISWASWIKAAPGFRDSARITSGEVISSHRESQFQVARRRQPAWESNRRCYHRGLWLFI